MLFAVILLYLILIYLSIFKIKSDYFIFLSFFLVFGIIGKYVLLTNFSFTLENIGQFDLNNLEMWAKANVLLLFGTLGIVAAAGAGYVIQSLASQKFRNRPALNIHPQLLNFLLSPYSNVALMILYFLIAYLNYNFSLNFVGLKSNIDNVFLSLTWSFFINHGFIIIATYFLYASFTKKGLSFFSTFVFLVNICLVSSTRLSRGFVFYCAPIFYKLVLSLKSANNLKRANFVKLGLILGSLFCLILLSTKTINTLRKIKFDSLIGVESPTYAPFKLPHNASEILNQATKVPDLFKTHHTQPKDTDEIIGLTLRVSSLFMGRFIGLEGILASSAYSEASPKKFFEAFINNVQDNVSFYDKYVINSSYQSTNNSLIKFGTLPGVIGFAGLSGSHALVFFICFTLTLFCFALEMLWVLTIRNQFAQSYFSAFLALGIAQFGFQPLHLFVHFITLYIFTYSLESLIRLHNKVMGPQIK